ncbi:hypothetical protein [Leucobacter sp. 1207-22]|uniref:hypothetical protein n=1 Tax=Leucobacter sp. 1207-22 TaxID=2604456 RepID=UPI004062CC36
MKRLALATTGSALVAIAGLTVALVFVRISLDWSDALPYEGAVTERRYIIFILIALGIFAAGLLCAVLTFLRLRKRR